MINIGDRINALEKRFKDLDKNFHALVRAGIDKFVAEEKAKHDAPDPEPEPEVVEEAPAPVELPPAPEVPTEKAPEVAPAAAPEPTPAPVVPEESDGSH